ncbi:beta-phosphoglucomutase [Parapedobacter sp. 2B3]
MTQHTLPTDKKAFIFDLDGVLVDTATFHYQAWKRLANSLGFDFTWQQNEKLKGVSRQQSLEYLLDWGNVDLPSTEKQRLAARKNDWYLELVAGMTHWDVLPGAFRLLRAAQAKGIRTALGSASKNAQLILAHTRTAECFDAVIDGNSVSRSKPHPEVFLNAARALDVPVSDCLVFEDAQAGIEAAIAAGMQVVGIGHPADLKGADMVVPGLVDLTL